MTSLTYDYEDRVTSIAYPGGGANTFAYNGLGARVSRTDSTGSYTYRRNGSSVTSPVLSDGPNVYTPGISERRSGVSKFYHSDLKNGVQQTDSSQTFAAVRAYDAFGMPVSSSGSWAGPFGYGGKFGYQSDPDSGLMLLGHRYYDPSTGRFLTRDPIQDGRNWYAYCGNNPISFADPEGLAYWVFNGRELILISDDGKTKKIIARIPAVSGMPGTTPTDAGKRNWGPIPPGEYSVHPDDIGRNRTFNWPGPDYSEEYAPWGGFRVAVVPKPRNRTRRSGFFIHGGTFIGSAGCIDVGPNDEYVMELIRKWSGGKAMTLIVDYGFGPWTPVPGTVDRPIPWLGGSRIG